MLIILRELASKKNCITFCQNTKITRVKKLVHASAGCDGYITKCLAVHIDKRF